MVYSGILVLVLLAMGLVLSISSNRNKRKADTFQPGNPEYERLHALSAQHRKYALACMSGGIVVGLITLL